MESMSTDLPLKGTSDLVDHQNSTPESIIEAPKQGNNIGETTRETIASLPNQYYQNTSSETNHVNNELPTVTIDSKENTPGHSPDQSQNNINLNQLMPLPKVAFFLAKAIGVVIVVVLAFYFMDYLLNVILAPKISIPINASTEEIARYQQLIQTSDSAIKEATSRIEQGIVAIVAAILIPLFTSMVGYIFGYSGREGK